jgi:hypothetical protein
MLAHQGEKEQNVSDNSKKQSDIARFLNPLFSSTDAAITVIEGSTERELNPEITVYEGHSANTEVHPVTSDGLCFVWGLDDNAQPDAYKGYRLRPSVVLRNGNQLLSCWALVRPVSLEDAAPLIAALGMSSANEPVPMPTTGGWELEHADSETCYELEELLQVYARANYHREAQILTSYDPRDARYEQPMFFMDANSRYSTNWRLQQMAIRIFVDLITGHRIGKKDGPAFVLADLNEGRRLKTAVNAVYGIGIDIDNGFPSEKIDETITALGCLAIRYTTHSHLKTKSDIAKSTLMKFVGRETFTNDDLRLYLVQEKGWYPPIADTVQFTGYDQPDKTVLACFTHAPMPKNRVIIPLAAPFVIKDQGEDRQQALDKWSAVLSAFAKEHNLPLDEACLDASRLFYFPRHAKGAPWEITIAGGNLFDWKSQRLDDALRESARKGSRSKSKSVTEEGRSLASWSTSRARGFQVVDVIENNCQEKIRGNATVGITIECPFDEDHSTVGDLNDSACFAVNASDAVGEIFTISCRHNSCRDKTVLDMLGKMLKESWFNATVLDDGRYYDDSRVEAKSPKARSTPLPGGIYEDMPGLMEDLSSLVCVLLGGDKVRLILEKGDEFEIVSTADAGVWLAKYRLSIEKGKKVIPGLPLYLSWPERVEFEGITSDPTLPRREGRIYTTWRGFTCAPAPGDWSLIRNHIRDVICAGDEGNFVWLMSWMAQMLQHPEVKLGTAVVLRGTRGCGKTTLGQILRKIIGSIHSRKVSHESHVTGKFNRHIRDCLFLLVEEGVWGGNKVAEGVLKDLITGDTAMIEAKHMNAIEFPNYTRVLITSNEDWIIPAGKSERRFLVLDVMDLFEGLSEEDPARAAYFDPIYRQMNEGGLQAMMSELLEWDWLQVNLRQPPMTDGLRAQMAQTFTDDQQWLLDALIQGGFTDRKGERIAGSSEWEVDVALEIQTAHLVESYRAHVATYSGSAASTQRMIKFLKKNGEMVSKRITLRNGERPWGYVLAPLRAWRERFTADHKYEFDDVSGEVVHMDAFRPKRSGTF